MISQTDAILEARARALARSSREDDLGPSLDLILVVIGEERYGLEIARVDEIQPLRGLAPIPGTPAFWSGIINLRGRLIPVLDLAVLLGLPSTFKGEDSAIGRLVVVASSPNFTAALRVDEVAEVRRVPLSSILPASAGTSSAVRDLVKGVTSDLITVLDLDAVLADPRLTHHD